MQKRLTAEEAIFKYSFSFFFSFFSFFSFIQHILKYRENLVLELILRSIIRYDIVHSTIQYNKQVISGRTSDKIVTQRHITSLTRLTFINLYHVGFCK